MDQDETGWCALDDVDGELRDERMEATDRRSVAPTRTQDNGTLPLFAGLL